MFRRLRIQNFKAWRDTGHIRLAPVTVFFGSNSAGKSSLLQFLLMLKQTAESPDRRRVLHPGDQHTPVDLGTYRDLIYDHNVKNRISFEVEWTPPNASIGGFKGDYVSFAADIAMDGENGQLYVQSTEYTLLKNPDELLLAAGLQKQRQRDQYDLAKTRFSPVRKRGRACPLPPPTRFYGFPEELYSYFQNADFLSDFVLALEQQLRRIQYLGPLRNRPARMYTWAGEVREHVGWTGEWAVEALLASADREMNFGPEQRKRRVPEIVAEWLRDMGLLIPSARAPLPRIGKSTKLSFARRVAMKTWRSLMSALACRRFCPSWWSASMYPRTRPSLWSNPNSTFTRAYKPRLLICSLTQSTHAKKERSDTSSLL